LHFLEYVFFVLLDFNGHLIEVFGSRQLAKGTWALWAFGTCGASITLRAAITIIASGFFRGIGVECHIFLLFIGFITWWKRISKYIIFFAIFFLFNF